jgi:hypothetical protein
MFPVDFNLQVLYITDKLNNEGLNPSSINSHIPKWESIQMNRRYLNQRALAGCFCLFLFLTPVHGQVGSVLPPRINSLNPGPAPVRTSIVPELKDLLQQLASASSNSFFQQHCLSIITVLDAVPKPTASDSLLLQGLYEAFSDPTVPWNASQLASYLARKRPFILSWTSPTDGAVSLAWLIPPENWNPDLAYPLYVKLHGLSDFYGSRIQYLTRYLGPQLLFEGSFQDGYTLLPWGRGNLWYQGIAETDVWESIDVAESCVHVNAARKYLTGMSMGGYGAWRIGAKSAETWAAMGIYAAALWYGGTSVLDADVIDELKDVPVYFICGTSDGLLAQNQLAYQLLQDAGDPDLAFDTFAGGHESLLENWEKMYAWIRNFSQDSSEAPDGHGTSQPTRTGIVANYPNPFNSETHLLYKVRIQSDVELTIYDPIGRKIRTVFKQFKKPGEYEIIWDGRDDAGDSVPSGMYVCCMLMQDSRTAIKILMLK